MTERNYVRIGTFPDPWNLTAVPNYEHAEEIDSLKASELMRENFFEQYVLRNRPCRLRGAAAHWPAFEKWRNPEYFKSASNNIRFEARHYPCSEFPTWAHEGLRQQLRDDIAANNRQMLFHDILDEMKGYGEQFVVEGCEFGAGAPLAELTADVGDYEFLSDAGKPRANALLRAFLYRGCYTDWHFHAADETLLTQVVGTKEVLILPPDDASWRALLPVIRERGYMFDVDVARYAQFGELCPYRVLVEPGDALYIPVFWWHAVESVGRQFGVTVACSFASPLRER
ncbi:cupin-like protein [Paraburkholderia sp. BL8N3]|nr:cupin-like domain-containing protein [Paraburkholderia sp. BL8N3]TCK33793.1 cupin-like protein [Paraburkholderia sp. BL8N3]